MAGAILVVERRAMAAFRFCWPDDFVPEEYGWVRYQVFEYPSDGDPLHWLRWQIPFRFPAVICAFPRVEVSGVAGGLYMGPINGLFPDVVTVDEVRAELVARRTPPGAGPSVEKCRA
jgi:hypothetical protein